MAKTAVALGCETVQIFSRSPRGGKAKELAADDVEAMKKILSEGNVHPIVVHVPYYLNLASKDDDKRAYSVQVLVEDLHRAEIIGANYLVTHVGHKDREEPPESTDALARVALSLNDALSRYSGPVRIVLENTAGQGQEIGAVFESIAALIEQFPRGVLGVCLDTCHAFSAGHDLSTPEGVRELLIQFDRTIGLDVLSVVHLNDSRGRIGSRIDRHDHIGHGHIGENGFRALIGSRLLPPDIPGILETPQDSPQDDMRNLETVRRLRELGVY